MAKFLPGGLQLGGDKITRGGVPIDGFLFDGSGNLLWGRGPTVPTNSSVGFAVGCEFIDTTGGANVTLYINEGTSAAVCDFNAAVDN